MKKTKTDEEMSLNDLLEEKRYWAWFILDKPELANSGKRRIGRIDAEISKRKAYV